MLRDMELASKVLLALVAKSEPEAIETVQVEGYDDIAVRYHEPVLTKTGRIVSVLAFNPSWHGYEFLDAVRNEAVWNKLKAQASDKGTALPFDVLKLLAIEAVKKMFGL